MLPHLGQGATSQIEYGMALATILAQADTSPVPASLLAYERLRRERVAEIQLGARQNGLVSIPQRYLGVRDAELARTPNSASASIPTTWCRMLPRAARQPCCNRSLESTPGRSQVDQPPGGPGAKRRSGGALYAPA